MSFVQENTSAISVSMFARSKRSNQGISNIQRTRICPLISSGLFTRSFVQEYTSANSVSMSAPSSEIQGTRIYSYAPTPGVGDVHDVIRTLISAVHFDNEKSCEALISSGLFTRSLVQGNTSADYVSVFAPFETSYQGICSYAPTPGVGNRCNGILTSISAGRTGPFTRSLVQGNTSADYVSVFAPFETSYQGICSYAPTPGVGNRCNGILTSISAGRTGDPYLVLSLAMPLVPTRNIADLEAKRKVTLEAMMDGPKDKSGKGKEVATDGATAAQSHEEGALRSLPLKGRYKEPGTSAQADNNENRYKDLPGTSAQADNNEKVEKTWFERFGPHVLNATMFLTGGIAGAYIFSQNASHVKMLNEKANDVNQKVWASSPCISFSPRIALVNIETGTSEGQGWRKVG